MERKKTNFYLNMNTKWDVCLFVVLAASLVPVQSSTADEELEKFMRGTLQNERTDTVKADREVKVDYNGNDFEKNTTSMEVKIESDVDGGNFTEDVNGTSNVAKGEPAFGDGIGSGFHGRLPRGQYNHGNQGQGYTHGQRIGNQGQSYTQGQHIQSQRNFGGHLQQERQYPGFGSPEIDGRIIGGLRVPQGDSPHSNFQQGPKSNTDQFGRYVVQQRVPDGRMGLPRPDGCLCTGPVLHRCCFEQSGGLIKGPSSTPHPLGHHHPHLDQQSNLKLPGDGNTVKQQTPVGLEYRGDFICPVSNGNFPHPTDCSRFLQCSHSVPYDTPCPESLLYDGTKGMCDWPDLVHCNTSTGSINSNQIFNTTLLIPSTWQVPWSKCRSIEVAVNAVLISVSQAVVGKACPNQDCQFPYIIVNCLK